MLLYGPIIKHSSFFIFSYLPLQKHTYFGRANNDDDDDDNGENRIPFPRTDISHLLSLTSRAHTGLDIRGFMVPNMVGRGRLDVHGIDIKFMCNFIGSLCGRYKAGYVSQHHVYKAS